MFILFLVWMQKCVQKKFILYRKVFYNHVTQDTVLAEGVGYFVLLYYSHKSLSIFKTRDRFEIWWSWCFQNTLNMYNLTKFWLRYTFMSASCFPSFFGPLESSQCPSSCSIFFLLLSGFYRVVKNICRLSQAQFVAVFRGQGRFKKIRNNWLKLTFQRS